MRMLLNDMKRALDRGVKIRILTGNYLGITQPSALYLIKSELGDRVDLRLYNETSRSFHPKSYIFHYESSNEIYIGSSNISKSALTSGIEWNYRFSDTLDKKNYELFYATFEDLFLNHSIIIDDEELKRYSKAWKKPAVSRDLAKYDATEDGEDRNAENVRMLYRPRGAQIEALYALQILHRQFSTNYEKNAPRLPQVAVYAIYKCLMNDVDRYSDFELKPLERMKTANRKSGTVGDIDLWENGRPIEAVEIKYEIPVGIAHVSEAIQKVQTESVERYFILSTAKPDSNEWDEVQKLISDFRKSNGCEIIVNGVYETIKYYLRLLKSTNEFVNAYTELLAIDEDINYEHKVAWNAICAERE